LIRQVICIYRFDGGIRGGAAYLAGRLRGDHACQLHTLTHRGVWANPEWSAMLAEFAVPVVLTHLDRCATPVRQATGHLRPCVLANCRPGPVVLLGPADLDRIGGSVAQFVDELRRAAFRAGLSWTLGMHDSSPATMGTARSGWSRTGAG
jgi:hypothetical protein